MKTLRQPFRLGSIHELPKYDEFCLKIKKNIRYILINLQPQSLTLISKGIRENISKYIFSSQKERADKNVKCFFACYHFRVKVSTAESSFLSHVA